MHYIIRLFLSSVHWVRVISAVSLSSTSGSGEEKDRSIKQKCSDFHFYHEINVQKKDRRIYILLKKLGSLTSTRNQGAKDRWIEQTSHPA